MNKVTNIILTAILLLTGWQMFPKDIESPVGGDATQACRTTHTLVDVGEDVVSQQLLGTTSRRAWARVELPEFAGETLVNGTTTVWLNLANGETAATGTGMGLFSSSTEPYKEFGLATIHPYIGAVTANKGLGSTTVRVSECVYGL